LPCQCWADPNLADFAEMGEQTPRNPSRGLCPRARRRRLSISRT
jgi:hypothetical protein